jgi:hypothetical protein
MATHQLWSIEDKRLVFKTNDLKVCDDEAHWFHDVLGHPVLLVIDCQETRQERIERRLMSYGVNDKESLTSALRNLFQDTYF